MKVRKLFAGLDLGGTFIKAGLMYEDGEILVQRQAAAEVESGVEHVLVRMAALVKEMAESQRNNCVVSGLGVGVAGLVDAGKGILWNAPNLPGWIEVEIGQRLHSKLRMPVAVDNDANAAAMGEYRFGAGRGSRHMLMVTLGTGVGGGLILNGNLYYGARDAAGEIGHTIIQVDGPLCSCGRRGCVEAFVGAKAICRRIIEELKGGAISTLASVPESDLTPLAVSRAADQGDGLAREILREAGHHLGVALGNAANLLNMERIVLGGGVAKAGDWLLEPARKSLAETALTVPAETVKLVPAVLGEKAGLVGAAYLAALKSEN